MTWVSRRVCVQGVGHRMGHDHPGAQTQVLDISPVYGAVVHAAHQYLGQATEEFLRNIFEEARTKGEL